MRNPLATITLLLLTLVACEAPEPEALAPEALADWMVFHAEDYTGDRSWRRAELEASLWRPELPYARKRLGSYALPEGGWDLLPEMDSEVAPVAADGSPAAAFEALSPAETPSSVEDWRALGERAFWKMPMRRDAYLEWIASQPELWASVGLEADDAGNIRGLTRYRDIRGQARVAMTCGLCHGAEGVAGRAHRGVNLGLARVLYNEALGLEPGVYESWGAGRVDVTDDGIVDPLTVADLWGVPHLTHINSSGSIERTSPATLAIRFETQFIEGHSMETRPDRTLVWALALFVQTLERPELVEPDMGSEGAEVFERACAGCHDPARGFSGGLVEAELLTSDPQAAMSPMRGTGYYKTPSLLGIGDAGPYLHDGSQATLTSLLESGHPFGAPLAESERMSLEIFLKGL